MKKSLLAKRSSLLLFLLSLLLPAKAASPLCFIENHGQIITPEGKVQEQILFTLQGNGVRIFIGRGSLHYLFVKEENPLTRRSRFNAAENKVSSYRMDMFLQGSNASPKIITGKENNYHEQHYTVKGELITAKTYDRITLENIYPGIDWVLYINNGKLKYDFIIHPGSDPSLIRMRYEGATDLCLDRKGNLEIKTPLGWVTEEKPFTYLNKDHTPLSSSFYISGNDILFSLASTPKNETIVIDPGLDWATYYGGSNDDISFDIEADKEGNVYMTGYTQSNSGISFNGFLNTYKGNLDAFLVKFSKDGKRLWSTYYGHTDDDVSYNLCLDKKGNIYITGYTENQSNISSNGWRDNYTGGISDAFLVKFDSSGKRTWATYFGGDDFDIAYGVQCDDSGYVYIGGTLTSTKTSTISYLGHQNKAGGSQDGFLAKFHEDGNLIWSTYYGGSNEDGVNAVAVDALGNVLICGPTTSGDYIATQNFYRGHTDAFLAKFNSNGKRLWSAYHGGGELDAALSVITDTLNNIYLGGYTESASGIGINGHQNDLSGSTDGFLVKFNPLGTLQWGTYYGGDMEDGIYAVSSDKENRIYVAGYTVSDIGISTQDAYQSIRNIDYDGFLAKFNIYGKRLWGTYYGKDAQEFIESCASDHYGHIYISGYSTSDGLGINGHQDHNAGMFDAILTKMDAAYIRIDSVRPNCDKIFIAFQKTSKMKSGNQFIAALSDANGDFTAPENIFTLTDSTAGSYQTNATIGIHTASTNYRIRIISTSPADTIFSKHFAIFPPPDSLLSVSAAAVCKPHSIKITADTNFGLKYTWYRNNIPLTDTSAFIYADSSASYKATITRDKNCAVTTDSVMVSVHPLPAKPVIIPFGNSILDAGSGYTSYKWYRNDVPVPSGTQQTLQVPGSGYYKVEVGNQFSCTIMSDSVNIIVAAIGNIPVDDLTVYPNPNTGNFVIEVPIEIEAGIYSLEGRMLKQVHLHTGKNYISMVEFPAGVYLLQSQSEPHFMPYKLIKY